MAIQSSMCILVETMIMVYLYTILEFSVLLLIVMLLMNLGKLKKINPTKAS